MLIESIENKIKDLKWGFSAVEVIVIVIILALVAAVITPQFSRADSETKLSDMVNGLQKIRSQIALYKVQHDGMLPGQKETEGDVTESDLVLSLMTRGADGCGPYLKEIPENPFNKLNTITCVNNKIAAPTGKERTGWWFNAATGEFRACDSRFHAAY